MSWNHVIAQRPDLNDVQKGGIIETMIAKPELSMTVDCIGKRDHYEPIDVNKINPGRIEQGIESMRTLYAEDCQLKKYLDYNFPK